MTTTYPTDPKDALDSGGAFVIGGDWGQDYTEQSIRSMFKVPNFHVGNALDVMRQQLMALPLEALEMFKAIIPDWIEDDFANIGNAVNKIMSVLIAPIRFLLEADWEGWITDTWNGFQYAVNQVIDILRGLIVTPINSAVQEVKDWWNSMTSGVTNNHNAITDLGNNVTGLVNGIVKALTGNDGTGSYVDPVEQLQYLADTVSGHSQAISELQAANNGEGNGGLSFTDNFSVSSTGGPPPGWTARSTNGNTTYVDTHEGRAQWYNSGNANPVVMWQRTDPATARTLTRFQKVVATATTPTAGTNAQNRVYGRMSPDGTHYVVGYVTNSTVYLAYAAGGAEVVFDSGPMPTKVSFSTGRQLILECGTNEGANEYALSMNGVHLVQHIDSAHAATDSTNFAARGLAAEPLGWAIGWRPGFNNFSQWQRPGSLSSASISDNVPVDVQGHGFRVYRETTSSSSAYAVLTDLSQFYDTIDYISPGSAWGSAGYTIPKSGMWSFSWRNTKNGTTNYTGMCFGLKVNGSGKTAGGVWRATTTLQDAVHYYCEKGDVVSPYVSILAGSANMIGDSAGLASYFSGSLMSG